MITKVTRLVCLLVIACNVLVYGQRQDTQFKTLWTNVGESTFSNPVSIDRTIGQSGHLLNIYWSNVSGQDCRTRSGHILQYFLEGSFDNTTWSVIKSTTYMFNESDPAGNIASQMDGYGAFPFLRARVIYLSGSGTANLFGACRLNGWYAGSITGNRLPTDRLSSVQDSFSRYSASVTGVGVLIANSVTFKSIKVWAMTVCSTTPSDITFTGGINPLYRLQFGTNNSCVTMEYNGVFLFKTDNGFALSVSSTSGTPASVNVLWSVD